MKKSFFKIVKHMFYSTKCKKYKKKKKNHTYKFNIRDMFST